MKDKIVTKHKNSKRAKLKKINYDNSKTEILIVIKMTVVTGTEVFIMTYFSKNILTTNQLSGQFFAILGMFLLNVLRTSSIIPKNSAGK